MPLSMTCWTTSRATDVGFFSSPPLMPPWSRSGVLRARRAPSRSQYQGFSLCSRTYFLNIVAVKNSMDSKPARSMRSMLSSMAAVFMLKAHRLWLPSRSVVSTNVTSLMCFPRWSLPCNRP